METPRRKPLLARFPARAVLKEADAMLDRIFKLNQNNTRAGVEIVAGLTTFFTMAYIIFVQPAVLSGEFLGPGKPPGVEFMDKTGVMLATCIASAFACFFMAFVANYPIALAPGMGENFFYGLIVAGFISVGTEVSWQAALGVIFISGVICTIISMLRIREAVVNSIPDSLKSAIAVGIGLLIATIGLSSAGFIVKHPSPGALVKMGDMTTPDAAIALVGLAVAGLFLARRMSGGLIAGIAAAAATALLLGKTSFSGAFSVPDFAALGNVAFKLDILGALKVGLGAIIAVFVIMDFFDSVGTFVGVARQANLMDEKGNMPRIGRALVADSVATVAGALAGTSTVTSYVESAAGIQHGGRTGLTAAVVGVLFLLAMFIEPLMRMVTGCSAITAPVLILVGVMMCGGAVRVNWDDYRESIPSFLIIAGIPLTMSIADGIAFGFISYAFLMIVSGGWRKLHWIAYALAALFIFHIVALSGLGA
ncbi:MAG TPA: NCS2 family permease [bacterium]|nr:NCS2 family permease [bacterium]